MWKDAKRAYDKFINNEIIMRHIQRNPCTRRYTYSYTYTSSYTYLIKINKLINFEKKNFFSIMKSTFKDIFKILKK